MITALKKLFEAPAQESEADRQRRMRLAAAALLIETARADFSQDASEEDALEQLLSSSLELDRQAVHELVEAATRQLDGSTSLYEFTRVINDYYSAQQKLELIAAMWRVAYADGDLDKYEERLIRQVSDLIHVSHKDFIRKKMEVAEAAGSS